MQKAKSRLKKPTSGKWVAPILLLATIALSYHLMALTKLKQSYDSRPPEIKIQVVYAQATESAKPAPSPTPQPTPAPKSQTAKLPVGEAQKRVYDMIGEVWGEEADLGRRMAFCESTYGTNVTNTISSARGTFQFLKGTWTEQRKFEGSDPDLELRFDERENITTAYNHYKRMGTRPWTASEHCWGN